mmetsp:Transcript_5705/g.6597  ORF Transcript_5705/g.6597 Transcript_5705/m.6597 type:complete len:90 (+) Transcript_5705:98-367(+)
MTTLTIATTSGKKREHQQMDYDENGIFQCLLLTVQLFCIPVHILYATGNNFVQLLFLFLGDAKIKPSCNNSNTRLMDDLSRERAYTLHY